jgi:hypothetical protein
MELGLARLAVCPRLAIITVGLATAAGCVIAQMALSSFTGHAFAIS